LGFGIDGFGIDGFGIDGLGIGGLGIDGLGIDGLGIDGLGIGGLGIDGLGIGGLGIGGFGIGGFGIDGFGIDGFGIDGLGIDGLGIDGLGIDGLGIGGLGIGGFGIGGFGIGGLGIDGLGIDGLEMDGLEMDRLGIDGLGVTRRCIVPRSLLGRTTSPTVEHFLQHVSVRFLVVSLASPPSTLSSLVLSTTEGTMEILSLGVAPMSEKANPAMPTAGGAEPLGKELQDGVDGVLILLNERDRAILLMPIRAKRETFRQGDNKKARFSVRISNGMSISSSYPLEVNTSRSGTRIFYAWYRPMGLTVESNLQVAPSLHSSAIDTAYPTGSRQLYPTELLGKERRAARTRHRFFFPSSGAIYLSIPLEIQVSVIALGSFSGIWGSTASFRRRFVPGKWASN
jgi:hypothetical protein